MKPLFTSVIIFMACCVSATARSHYATIHNRFSPLATTLHSKAGTGLTWSMNNDVLRLENKGEKATLVADTTLLGDEYSYLVRAALNGNKSGKRDCAWGIFFNHADSDNYCCTMIEFDNSKPIDDIAGQRQARITTVQRIRGESHLLSSVVLSKGVNLYDGFNTMSVTCRGHDVIIEAGKNQLQQVDVVTVIPVETPGCVGITIYPGASMSVERTVLTSGAPKNFPQATSWTRESLAQHFLMTDDPMEGFWTYQDRDMEDKWLRLGGRYTVALVASDQGYDIIYVDGGQVNAASWLTGLLKGHIDKTIFDGHYDLMWIDSNFEAITQDAYASLENGVLLTLNFPVYKSQIRFSKVLNP